MTFDNVYDDAQRASSYATLEFPGTYYLAYRDLPEIINTHATAGRGLDFGCGAGRSTRFLKRLGYNTVGIDISEDMIKLANTAEPGGEYRKIDNNGIIPADLGLFDLVLSVFTFDNIPTWERKISLFTGLRDRCASGGRIVSLVSSPEIYTHEWASFTTRQFKENFVAKTGDIVKTIMTDIDDRRPVEDIFWPDDAYGEVYAQAGLQVVQTYRPLGRVDEPYPWVSETTIAPWTIYVLERSGKS
jgi:SAM-dependent methyltransferase